MKLLQLAIALLVMGCSSGITVESGSDTTGGNTTDAGVPPVEECSAEEVAGSCTICMTQGCTLSSVPCEQGAEIFRTFIKCTAQKEVQDMCPACVDLYSTKPIPAQCITCAAPISGCSFNCETEVDAGQ